jgi:DNA-binding transcriptional ArsR family regulator
MQPLHRIFKALAEPNRLRIINLLLERPFCVCELENLLGLPQSLISRHLAYLRGAGLVVDKRQGMRVQYSLAGGDEMAGILETCLRRALLCEEIYRQDRRRCEELLGACCASEPGQQPSSSEISILGASR